MKDHKEYFRASFDDFIKSKWVLMTLTRFTYKSVYENVKKKTEYV